MSNIYISKNFIFSEGLDFEYHLSVEDDFTDIEYFEYTKEDHKWHKLDSIRINSDFAYEIAKEIIKEYERINNNGMA